MQPDTSGFDDSPFTPLGELGEGVVELGHPGSMVYLCRGALSEQVCDTAIAMFKDLSGSDIQVDAAEQGTSAGFLRKATDMPILSEHDHQHMPLVDQAVFESAHQAVKRLQQVHRLFLCPATDTGYLMRRYAPGGGYKWHMSAGPVLANDRLLAMTWFLNEVTLGGAEEFLHQKIQVAPEKGSLLMFPAFWTHVHRTCEVKMGERFDLTSFLFMSQQGSL